MRTLRRIAKGLFQRMTGLDVERLVGRSFLLIDQKRRGDAWFSYEAQLRAFIEQERIDLVLDVGANVGQFAQMLRSFYKGPILSFEPVLSVFEKLQNAASFDPDWHVYNCALGSREGAQSINVSESTVFSSLLRSNEYCSQHFGAHAVGTRAESVPVRRADALLEEIFPKIRGARVFLKMDTQGYDTAVFEGLGTALAHVVLLQSEVSLIPIYAGMPHWTESIATYEKNGFGVVGMFPVSRDSSRVVEYDCLLVKWNRKAE